MCHAIYTCGSNCLVFGPRSDHGLCSHLLVPNQAGLHGHIHALWNSTGTILVCNSAFQASLAGEQLPRLFCAVSQLRSYQEPIERFQLPGLTIDSLQEDEFLYLLSLFVVTPLILQAGLALCFNSSRHFAFLYK